MSGDQFKRQDRGPLAEEAFREYFRSRGSLALRAIPLREGSVTVTDIDLWVYTRATAHARHVAIVDIKNKRRGKPFERAIWVKGLQTVLGADEATIASKGLTESAQRFSERLAVHVTSPSVFDAIIRRFGHQECRLTTEQLNMMWKDAAIDNTSVKACIDSAKAEISRSIDFRALNSWLDEGARMLVLAAERERVVGPFTRAAYFCCSLIALGADYLGRHLSLSETEVRKRYFRIGMTFGRTDIDAAKEYLDFAESAVKDFLDNTGSLSAQFRFQLEKALENMPIQGLAEFFSRRDSGLGLMKAAMELEYACHARDALAPRELTAVEAKSVIGLVADYAGVSRKDILGANDVATDTQDSVDSEREEQQGTLML